MLATDGIQGLSLRKLARKVGVSHNAPYQHFADKEALVVAIAQTGFDLLNEAVDEAVTQAGDSPLEQIKALGVYVQFARDYPQHFDVMFHPYDPKAFPELYQVSRSAFDRVVQVISYGQQTGLIVAGQPDVLAMMLWSLLHGTAHIANSNRIPNKVLSEDVKALVDTFMNMLLSGIGTDS